MLAGNQNKKRRHLYSQSQGKAAATAPGTVSRACAVDHRIPRALLLFSLFLSLPARISINARIRGRAATNPLIFRRLSQRQAIPGLIYNPGPIKSIGDRCRKSIATSRESRVRTGFSPRGFT